MSGRINQKKMYEKTKYQYGMIMGMKKNNLYEVKLYDSKTIVNVQLEGVNNLEVRLQIKEFDEFKEKSANYIRDHYLQRDVDLQLNDFNEASCTFYGKIFLHGKDIAEGLISKGYLYTESWYAQNNINYLKVEEEAKSQEKGLWTQLLNKFRSNA